MRNIHLLSWLFLFSISCSNHELAPNDEAFDTRIDSIAFSIFQSNKINESFRFIDSIYAIPKHQSLTGLFCKYNFKTVRYRELMNRGDTSAVLLAKIYLDSMQFLFNSNRKKEKEYPNFFAIGHSLLGDEYLKNEFYDSAFASYSRSLQLVGNVSSFCDIASINYRLGMVSYKQERFDLAKTYFLNSFNQSANCEGNQFYNFFHRQEILSNVALCYEKIGKSDSVIFYCRKNLDFIQNQLKKYNIVEIQSLRQAEAARGVIYSNLGNAYLAQKQTDSAVLYMQKSISINSRPGYENGHAQSVYLDLAEAFLQQNNKVQALKVLNQLQLSLAILKNKKIETKYHLIISRCYELINKPSFAFKHLQLYLQFHDSFYAKEKKLLKLNIEDKLESSTKQYQIDLLKEQEKASAFRIRFIVIILLLFIVVILLVLLLYTRERKALFLLKERNKKIEQLLKEVHHRVKNNLQIVSSFINIQLNKLKDKDARIALQDTSNRIMALAGLHRSLYGQTDLSKINLKDYIEELGRNISANINCNNVQISYQIEDLKLDIDQAIPLGLAVNELITNSLKYAFDDDQQGQIDITLTHTNNWKLLVRDNGRGLPENMDLDQLLSIGIRLVKDITETQLKGQFSFYNDNGAVFKIEFVPVAA